MKRALKKPKTIAVPSILLNVKSSIIAVILLTSQVVGSLANLNPSKPSIRLLDHSDGFPELKNISIASEGFVNKTLFNNLPSLKYAVVSPPV